MRGNYKKRRKGLLGRIFNRNKSKETEKLVPENEVKSSVLKRLKAKQGEVSKNLELAQKRMDKLEELMEKRLTKLEEVRSQEKREVEKRLKREKRRIKRQDRHCQTWWANQVRPGCLCSPPPQSLEKVFLVLLLGP